MFLSNRKSPKSKSFLFQCREAARYSLDRDTAYAMREAADDLQDAIDQFTVAVTAETLAHLNSQWARATVIYNTCMMVQPTPPAGGRLQVPGAGPSRSLTGAGELDKIAVGC